MTSHKGLNGTMHVDDDAVVFTREGLTARGAFGKNAPPQRIPLGEITGVVHKPAGRVANGHIQLLRNGLEAPSVAAAKDPDGIQYTPQKKGEFEPLAEWLRTVADKNRPIGSANTAVFGAGAGRAAAAGTGGAQPTGADQAGGSAWYQRRGTQLAAAALLGLLLGSCGGDDSAEELDQLRDDRAAAASAAEDAEERADPTAETRDELQARVAELEEQNQALQAEVTAAQPEPEPEPEPEPLAPAPVEEAPAVEPQPAAEPEPAEAYYANCAEVRAAGAAPIRSGEPGYRSGLDRDGDGIACDT